MLDWIKQALGSFGEIQNKNGYGQEILRLAEKGLTAQVGEARKLMQLEESLRNSGLNLLPVDSGTSPRILAERLLRLTFCIGVVRQLGQ